MPHRDRPSGTPRLRAREYLVAVFFVLRGGTPSSKKNSISVRHTIESFATWSKEIFTRIRCSSTARRLPHFIRPHDVPPHRRTFLPPTPCTLGGNMTTRPWGRVPAVTMPRTIGSSRQLTVQIG